MLGNSVKWRNTTGKRHDATPTVNWSWAAVSVAAGATSAAVSPSQAGSFPYFCSLHPTIKGTINVPMTVSPLAGTTATFFSLTLGTVTAPGVLVHQVEVRLNGGAWQLRATPPRHRYRSSSQRQARGSCALGCATSWAAQQAATARSTTVQVF